MESTHVFNVLLLLARPAAGKSEIIDFLNNLPTDERREKYHVGDFTVIDDFPMLWAWFEEDDILSRLGHPRLHTNGDGNFIDNYMWDLLIERINLDYHKIKRDTPTLGWDRTAIVEFSRGSEHGGYKRAFDHLSEEILQDMVILYVDVPWEESLRKNRKRFNPDKPDSILEHGLSDTKLESLYKAVDWQELVKDDEKMILIKGHRVPYCTFDNADDVTTVRGKVLGTRLRACLDQLWAQYD